MKNKPTLMNMKKLKEKLIEKYADNIEKEFHRIWKTDNGSANVENYIIDLVADELSRQHKEYESKLKQKEAEVRGEKVNFLKEIERLYKKIDKYGEFCLSEDNHDPFKTTNAYWAVGYQQFLGWLKQNK